MENRALAAELSNLLVKERERLAKRIAAIDELIGKPVQLEATLNADFGAFDTKPMAPITLFPQLVKSLLRGREMTAAQIANELRRIGHKSRTRNLEQYVRVTIAGNRHLYTRVSRGVYTAKESA